MSRRIATFVPGEVLRAARLNELVDASNAQLSAPRDTSDVTRDTEYPGTWTVWTEIDRTTSTERVYDPDDESVYVDVLRIETVSFTDGAGNVMALVFDNS